MAETYKGLTIRIGGDTTGLQKSLKSVTSSIAATENQLRRMRSALNMDPGSTSAMSRTLDLMGQKAIETNRKVLQLKSGLEQIAGQRVRLFDGTESVQTVRQLAELTQDANQRAADAKENYAAITAELAKFYRPINEAVDATGKLDGELDKAKEAAREFSKAWSDAHDGKGFSTSEFIQEDGLDAAIQKLKELGLMTDEQEAKLRDLRQVYGDAFDENEIAKLVAQFEDGNVELERMTATANAATRQFSELSRAAMMTKYGEGIDDSLGHIENAAKSLEGELKQIDDALRFDPHNVDLLAQKMRDLQESSHLAQAKVETLEEKLRRLSADGAGNLANDMADVRLEVERTAQAYDEATAQVKQLEGAISAAKAEQSRFEAKGDDISDEYQQAKAKVEQLEGSLASLRAEQERTKASFRSAKMAEEFVETRTQVERARSEVKRYNDEIQEMSRFSGVTAGSLTSLGMSLSTSVTPTLIAAGWGIVESANDIDSAYRDMRKTVNGTEKDFEDLRQAAIDFSTTNVTSADQMMSIQAIGGELGVATEDIKEFAETVSNLDVATNLNAEEAATALGQLRNILHLTGDDLAPFSDAIVRLGNNGASTESQIVDIANRIGSMGSIVGMSAPDILAWASAIASTGQNSEAAGTAISNTMSDIETAVSAGEESLQAFADVARMSAEDFANTWNTDPTQALKSFIEGLIAIEEDGGSADSTLGNLDITAARQKQAIMGLMQTVDGLDDSLRMSNDAFNGVSDQWGEAGDAAREAEAKAEGFSGSMSRLQNIAQALGAELGESLVPIIDGVADFLGELFEQFEKMPDGMKQAIVVIGGVVAALGPLILLGKGIGDFFGQISDGIATLNAVGEAAKKVEGLADATDLVASSTGILSTALGKTLAAGGIAVAVGAIAGLIGMYSDWQQKQENLRTSTEGLRDVVRDTTSLDDYASGIENIDESAEFAAMSVDELAESTSKHVQSMRENTDAAEAEIAQLNTAQDIINRYAGQTDLTAEAQGRLEWALRLVNDQFGLSITQADVAADSYRDQDGNVRDLTDSINALIDAKKEEARVNALTANLTEAYQIQQDAGDTLAQAQKDYEDYVDTVIDLNKKAGREISRAEAEQIVKDSEAKAYQDLLSAQTMYADAVASTSEIETELGSATAATSELADEFDRLSSTMGSAKFDLFNSQLKASGTNFEMLKDDLRSLGVNTEQFSNLSQDELKRVADSYDGTASSVIGVLDELGVSMSDTGRQAAEMALEIQGRIEDIAGGSIATKLEGLGYNLSDLSQKMADAGITSDMLRGDIVGDFDAILAMAGDDVNKLIFLIQNYNSTPIADKNGNITADTVQLRDAQGQIYIWNGTQLINQHGQVTVQGIPELYYANGEVAQWNDSGQLIDKNGSVVVTETELYDAQQQVYTWNESGQLIDKNGAVHVDQLELHDAYDNVVKLNDTELLVQGEVKCDYSEAVAAKDFLDSFPRSVTSTVYVNTVRTTTNRVVNQTVGPTPAPASYTAAMPDSVPTVASTLAAKAKAMSDGASLMSEEASRAVQAMSAAPRAAAYTASELVGSSTGTSLPGNRRSIHDYGSLGEVVNNYYDVTVDGNGTSSRVETIVLALLDQLEKEARL